MDVTMLINKTHPLPDDYQPEGLIDLFSLEDRLHDTRLNGSLRTSEMAAQDP